MPCVDRLSKSRIVREGREVDVRPCLNADYSTAPVLTTDEWAYVSLWMDRKKSSHETKLFWSQARAFAGQARLADTSVRPLLDYYAFMNASKALLSQRNLPFSPYHGLKSVPPGNERTLQGERVEVKADGVFQGLARYFTGQGILEGKFDLKTIMRNIVCIHSAYNSTYRSHASDPRFLPIPRSGFVHGATGRLVWEAALQDYSLHRRRADRQQRELTSIRGSLLSTKPGIESDGIVAYWEHPRIGTDEHELREANESLRNRLHYIVENHRIRRYLHKDDEISLGWPQLCHMYAAMFHFSSRVRYHPDKMAALYAGQQNWLISEFLSMAPRQYLGLIASEITGHQLRRPYAKE